MFFDVALEQGCKVDGQPSGSTLCSKRDKRHFLVGEDIRTATIVGLIFIVVGSALQQLVGRPPAAQKRAQVNSSNIL